MIDFEKWHGNGNDFVIINSIEAKNEKSDHEMANIFKKPYPR